jgi:recombination protein RecA
MAGVTKKKTKLAGRAAALAAEINSTLKLNEGIRLGNDPFFEIHRVPTGSLVMDRITGGGFALGRHYELFGDESVGKSYIVYRTMALSQRRGNLCAIVDPEHSFDSERFKFLGGNPSELLIQHPQTAEDAVAVMMLIAKYAKEQQLEIVGIDSVASLVTNDEAAKDPREEDRMASQARMMSKALRRITTVNKKTLFLWTNQERMDIGVRFGNPKTTSGGRALRYYATGRIEFRRGAQLLRKAKVARAGKLVETDKPFGRWVQIKVVKDKSTSPGREGAFVFNHRMKKIDPAYEIIQLGLEDGLIQRSSNGWYSYVDLEDYEWKGTEKKFTKWLNENEDLFLELESVIRENTLTQEEGDDEAEE